MKRGAVLGAILTMTAVLAACGTQTPGSDGEQSPQSTQAASGPEISNPKDAAAVPPCDLLAPDVATNLGIDPESGQVSKYDEKSCGWYSPDEKDQLSLTAIADRPLSSYLDTRSQFADFQELTIAGHPAVRANRNDPKELGTCDIFLATKDNQILSAQASFVEKTKDPCGFAQQALETVVPGLPAAS